MKNHVWGLASFSFSATFGIYLFLQARVRDLDGTSAEVPLWLDWLIATGAFMVMFSALIWAYERSLYRTLNRSRFLNGIWFQVFIISGDSPIRDRVRHGQCHITTTLDTINFSANNLRIDGSFSSNWNSQAVLLSNRQLSLMFVSEGNRNGSRGTMNFNLQGSPPQCLIGQFNDSSPAKHHGDIRIFKKKYEYEKWLTSITS